MNLTDDLIHWLNQVTKGLSAETGQLVWAEIEAHYADAIVDHLSQGKTPLEAHRAAMTELGDERVTAQALRDTHLAERKYKTAVVLGIILPSLLPFATVTLHATTNRVEIILLVALLFPTLYAFSGLKLLLEQRCNFHEAAWPLAVIQSSGLLLSLAALLFPWLVKEPLIVSLVEFRMMGVRDVPIIGLVTAVCFGVVGMGLGLLWFGDKLLNLKKDLYGLIKPLSYLMVTCGLGLLTLVLAFGLSAYEPALLVIAFSSWIYLIAFALILLLLFRAVYRPPSRPIRLA